MKKSAITTAVAAALGLGASAVSAAPVAFTGLTIQDVGSNTVNAANAYSSALDGNAGAFRFGGINLVNYTGSSPFVSDVGTGVMLAGGAANPTGSFSTGFIFSSAPFVPFTFGSGFAGTIDTTSNALSISSIDFGGNFGGGTSFFLAPDAGTLEVLWSQARGNGTDWDVAFRWSHNITTADDPTLAFTPFSARWVLEGCLSTSVGGACAPTAIPVPAAVWLFGSGLLGLVGVARRRKGQKV